MTRINLKLRDVLHEPGQPIRYVYFPNSGVLSLIHPATRRRIGVEVGLVGREGVAGLPVLLGTDSFPFCCLVQAPGEALRLSAAEFHRLVLPTTPLYHLLLVYTHTLLTQMALTVACNALHPISKRLCRWLLAVHDRVAIDEFPMTHDFMAAMLGVRRASISVVAHELRASGLVHYAAGRITILDRPGLESASCECYRIGRAEVDRVLH